MISPVEPVPLKSAAQPWLRWLGLGSGVLLVFAARTREVHLYAGDVPFIDQWKAEGAEIMQPWRAGTLGLVDFFKPHNGHLPVWSRLLVWLEAVCTGQWDPRVQMAVNAALHATYVGFVLRWLWSSLAFGAALVAGGLLLALAILPFSWENITWGFQSQFPLALLFLFLHVRGVLTHPLRSRAWWCAQLAGLAGLFTLGVMATAPLSVALVLFWTGTANRRTGPVLLGLVILGIALGVIAPTPTDSALFVHSAPVFLHAWFVQLAWPTEAIFINLPLLLLALRMRGRRDTPAFDRIVLALGLWAGLQAAAIGFARSAEYIGFTSRYGDLLAVGVLANFLALLRLLPGHSWARGMALAGLLAWVGVVGHGLYVITTTAHTAYFHQHSAEQAAWRAAAVRAYAQDGDISHLTDERIREVLYPDPAEVARQLSSPGFRELLPVVAGPSRIGVAVRELQRQWALLGAIAIAGLVVSLVFIGRTAAGRPALPRMSWSPDPWRGRLAAAIVLTAWAALFLWPRPLVFGEVRRKMKIIQASGTIAPLRYAFDGTSAFPPERIEGAAQLMPGEVRNIFHGPVDLARVSSNSFELVTPYLIVPFAGHPTAPGVALQVVVEDERGGAQHTYTCAGPALADVGFWEIDVRADQKRTAHLAMVDASSDPASWIAAAPPQYAWKPGQAALRSQGWAAEKTAPTHDTLGWIGLLALVGCVAIGWRRLKPFATRET